MIGKGGHPMSEESRNLVASVKHSIVAAVKGVGEITDAVVDTVSSSLVLLFTNTVTYY
jgi:hypothetical protein